jgi:P-type Cu+ transporter
LTLTPWSHAAPRVGHEPKRSTRAPQSGRVEKEGGTMKVTDPVCGMSIESEKAEASESYRSRSYYFCSAHCQRAFKADAARWLS